MEEKGKEGGRKDLHIWNHFRSARALAVKGEPGRLAGENSKGGGGSDTGHTIVRDQRSGKQPAAQKQTAEKKAEMFLKCGFKLGKSH